MANAHAPFHPIIYVRGYAMTSGERDDTAADPFCGFNLGSTVYRAQPDKSRPARKFIFESPMLRLMSDDIVKHVPGERGYQDVYENGLDIMDPEWTGTIPYKSIIIYRYYDSGSELLGSGKVPEIEDFARGLSQLILRVRELACQHPENALAPGDFRCYLVAHSMGGLVCRAFLQNPALGDPAARALVDKFFTYATPHNGIEVLGANVPRWMSPSDINNFSRKRMADYLHLKSLFDKTRRVDWLPEHALPASRMFCMVGSNRSDYEAALGVSRTFVGHGSDGLVKIENASVWGVDGQGRVTMPCATAYAYRAHSGHFGIVNSEESYQNLTRFLFGDVRVDLWLDVEEVRLPPALEGKPVDALYQFEVLASPRGKRWYLTRRTAEEDSAACRSHQQLIDPADTTGRHIYLSSVFLANSARVNPEHTSLAYSLTLGVRVPDYEVEKKFWPDAHYEGGYLFHDSVVVELVPPPVPGGEWVVHHDWQSKRPGQATKVAKSVKLLKSGQAELRIPFKSSAAPGIAGTLRFVISAWNDG